MTAQFMEKLVFMKPLVLMGGKRVVLLFIAFMEKMESVKTHNRTFKYKVANESLFMFHSEILAS